MCANPRANSHTLLKKTGPHRQPCQHAVWHNISLCLFLRNKKLRTANWVELRKKRSVTMSKDNVNQARHVRAKECKWKKSHREGEREKAWKKRSDWRCDSVRQTLFVQSASTANWKKASVCMRLRKERGREEGDVIESNQSTSDWLREKKKEEKGERCADKFYTLKVYHLYQSGTRLAKYFGGT